MASLGYRNLLKITRETVHGVYVDAGDLGEILVPRRDVPIGASPGEELDVFLYRDSEDRLVATTAAPLAELGDLAVLRVRDYDRQIGAFLDWGLAKDLLLPHREQSTPLYPGDDVVVMILLDPVTDRLFATQRLYMHLSKDPPLYDAGQPVHLLIARETELGWAAVIEGKHIGLLYHNQLHQKLFVGQQLDGYVGAVRPDGKIDLTLESSGRPRVKSLADEILDALQDNNGRLELDDSSSPEEIRARFGTSKKAFKQAVGHLYRQRMIAFCNPGIELVRQSPNKNRR